jgi:very-short-patch-repair endonuclease
MKKDISNDAKRSYGYEMADPLSYTLLKDFANENRKKPTEAENLLWDCIKGNLLGVHFRRQHIIGLFIADFACLSHKLIIEIDGKYHQLPDQQISDKERTEWLEQKGFKVMRFTNEQIINYTNKVLKSIQTYIIKELPVSV